MIRHASLFAGVDAVGVAVRALEGETVLCSEFDPTPISKKKPWPRPLEEQYNHRILRKRLPDAKIMGDVRDIDWREAIWGYDPNFFSAGFPCQDLSSAGQGAGLDGARSGLYVEVIRMISEVRPGLVMIENVPRLLTLHFERLLRDLRDLGYDCEWDVIPAAAVDAPHLRNRLFLLAYQPDDSLPSPRAYGPIKRISSLNLEDDGVKWHRAGLMLSGQVFELEPVAPEKTKRVDGRSYWVGNRLFGGEGDHVLLPTPTKQDGSNLGGPSQLKRNSLSLNAMAAIGLWPTPERSDGTGGHVSAELGGVRPSGAKRAITLSTAVNHGLWPTPTKSTGNCAEQEIGGQRESGAKRAVTLATAVRRGLFPTPTANDDNKSPEAHLAMKARLQGGARRQITSLSVLARAGFPEDGGRALSEELFPTAESAESARQGLLPTPQAADGERTSEQGPRFYANGENNPTLLGAARLWPTPSTADGHGGPGTSPKRTGGKNLRTEIHEQEKGYLNPDWVEWMMGLPVGHTDIDCDEPAYRPFWDEPMPRVLAECPNRRQRLHAIGNSLVWLIPYWILSRYQERCGLIGGVEQEVDLSVFS